MKTVIQYANKARIEVRLYKKPKKGYHPTDRIHMNLTMSSGKRLGCYMNGLEAADIIRALGEALAEAIALDIPLSDPVKEKV